MEDLPASFRRALFEELEGWDRGGSFGDVGSCVERRRSAVAVVCCFLLWGFGGVCGAFGWCW